jgi:hypothetical protein
MPRQVGNLDAETERMVKKRPVQTRPSGGGGAHDSFTSLASSILRRLAHGLCLLATGAQRMHR